MDLQNNLSKVIIENNAIKHKYTHINMELEQSHNEFSSKKKMISGLEFENKCFKDYQTESMVYTEILEKEIEKTNFQIQKLSKQYPELQQLLTINQLNTLKKLKKKALNELNMLIMKKIENVVNDKHREKYVLTDLFDITKEVNYKDFKSDFKP